MQCYQCGENVLRESVFCHRCGARLDANSNPGSETGAIDPERRDEAAADSGKDRRLSTGRLRDAANPGHAAGESEQILWEGGYSSKAMVSRWLFSILAMVGLVLGGIWWPRREVWLAVAAMAVLLWGYQFLVLMARRSGVYYRLTDQRFIHQLGVLRRVTDRIDLIDVNDITFEQGLIDRLSGTGTIHIASKDRSHPELTLVGIADVAHVAGIIDQAFRAERRRRGLVVENLRRPRGKPE